jgi:DNA-binding Xre family transcriptional regulator
MNISYYEEILEECFESYPFLRNGFVDYRPAGEYSIRLDYEDGHKCIYDTRTRAFKGTTGHKELIDNIKNITDEYCKNKIANNLNDIMCAKGYTQSGLARDTGLSIGTVNNYLYGKASPSITKLAKIAYVLNCTMDDLLD